MKIIYGITKSNFGGAQRYVFDLVTEAKKKDHDVAVMTGGEGELTEKLREAGVRVISIPNMKREISLLDEFRSLHFIFRTLFEEKPDVFHTNSSKMGGLGNLAARFAGIDKVIFTAHNWAFNWPRPAWQKVILKFLQWLTIIFSHQTICVSEQTRKEVESWPFVKNKLVVIYNGVKEFDLIERDDPTFTVGVISELHKIKGLDIILKAWNKFIKNNNAKLVIIGEGEERKNLENMAQNLGILDSVNFKGFLGNARSLLSTFDIYCMPSRSEGMPYALLEAGIVGLPVIATKVGGIPEIIESGVNGILVEKENAEEIFSSLLLLSQDESLRKRLGTSLRKKILNDFSVERMVEKTFSLYL